MSTTKPEILKELTKVREILKKDFKYITTTEELPQYRGGSNIRKIYLDPKRVFHFLMFLYESEYFDADKDTVSISVDDKVKWELYIQIPGAFIRIYDWKDSSVSIGSVGNSFEVREDVKVSAERLALLIEDNFKKFDDYKKAESKFILESDPLGNFIQALISLRILTSNILEVNKTGYGYIERLILFLSTLDSLLRYALLLTRINHRKSKHIDSDLLPLIWQEDGNYISEREVYRLAEAELDFGENNKAEFIKGINSLYDERNKVVHRFAITNFQYAEISNIIDKYAGLEGVLSGIVVNLEREQSELGVGFVTPESLESPSSERIKGFIEKAFEVKIDPSIDLRAYPEVDAMFSDKYPGGVHPVVKKKMKSVNGQSFLCRSI